MTSRRRFSVKGLIICLVGIGLVAFFVPFRPQTLSSSVAFEHPANFPEAKRFAKQLFKENRRTFYCGCRFDAYGKVDLKSCGYKVQGDRRRAQRLEWEHIVPVSRIASHLPCWSGKGCCEEPKECIRGRRCCQKVDKNFQHMEADLHNLVPEIGELNAIRSNFRFGVLPHVKPGQFGQCEFKVDKNIRRVEPSASKRGLIARTYLYMADTYNIRLSDAQRQLFKAWNNQFPPTQEEIAWDNKIAAIQKNHNPYIVNYDMTGEKRNEY